MSQSNLRYRPEIDGLRALAVIAVLIYHGSFSHQGNLVLTGGYLGVDVFFVISGYLIARIITFELRQSDNFKFFDFYERRARRLLPTMIVVFTFCLCLGYLRMPPDAFTALAKALVSSVFFFANGYFYLEAVSYGAEASLNSPLLHLWSLSVEEQFYFIAPLCLLLTFKFARPFLFLFLTVAAFLSWETMGFLKIADPELNFFNPLSRAWQLLAGAMLGIHEVFNPKLWQKLRSSWICDLLAGFGILLVISSMFYFDETINHPSTLALIPTAGTVMFIGLVSNQYFIGWLSRRALLVWIGLFSYSLYLWHLPVYALGKLNDSTPSNYDKVEWILASLLLATLTYFFIEKPFRSRQLIQKKYLLMTVGIGLAGLVTFATIVIKRDGLPDRTEGLYTTEARQADQRLSISQNYIYPDLEFRENKPLILIVGDSYIQNWATLVRHFDTENLDVLPVSYLGCLFEAQESLVFVGNVLQGEKYDKNCEAIKSLDNPEIFNRIKSVMLVSHRPFRYNNDTWRFQLLNWIKRNAEADIDIFVFGNYWQLDPAKHTGCLSLMLQKASGSDVCIAHADYNTPEKQKGALVSGPYLDPDLNFHFIDIFELLETDSGWPATVDGVPFMTDWNHLSRTFVDFIGKELRRYDGENDSTLLLQSYLKPY